MAQYPIPQFIEQEGKIIFFLTFKQFFWLTGGIGACMLMYFVLPFYFFAVFSIIVLVAVGVIAFVRINNASLITVFLSFTGFVFQNKKYTWVKKEVSRPYQNPDNPAKTPATQKNQVPQQPIIPMTRTSKLQEIRKMIDTKK